MVIVENNVKVSEFGDIIQQIAHEGYSLYDLHTVCNGKEYRIKHFERNDEKHILNMVLEEIK